MTHQSSILSMIERCESAVKRGRDRTGTMPAKQAVKVTPEDWNAICDLAREAAAALRALAATE